MTPAPVRFWRFLLTCANVGNDDVVLAGDACYLRRTLDHLHLPTAAYDREQMLESLRRLRALRDTGAVIITGHDPEMWKTIPQAPEPLTSAIDSRVLTATQ